MCREVPSHPNDSGMTRSLSAVWSFWTSPFSQGHSDRWFDEEFHLLSWALSFHCAAAYFDELKLVTDSAGARLLVDELKLPFTSLSTSLDRIDTAWCDWWVLGKLRAYQEQQQPFVHLDSDVYLWNDLPGRLKSADILTQNPEPAPMSDTTYYKPCRMSWTLQASGGHLPSFIRSYMASGGDAAFCTGIFGGSALDLIHEYATAAELLVTTPANAVGWQLLNDPFAYSACIEQYVLAAICSERIKAGIPLDVQHLFPSRLEAWNEAEAARIGFTHLIASAKKNPVLKQLVANRLRSQCPARYETVCRLTDRTLHVFHGGRFRLPDVIPSDEDWNFAWASLAMTAAPALYRSASYDYRYERPSAIGASLLDPSPDQLRELPPTIMRQRVPDPHAASRLLDLNPPDTETFDDDCARRQVHRMATIFQLVTLRDFPEVRADGLDSLISFARRNNSFLGLASVFLSLMTVPALSSGQRAKYIPAGAPVASDAGQVVYDFVRQSLHVLRGPGTRSAIRDLMARNDVGDSAANHAVITYSREPGDAKGLVSTSNHPYDSVIADNLLKGCGIAADLDFPASNGPASAGPSDLIGWTAAINRAASLAS